MKKETVTTQVINSISELHRILGLPKPAHPLMSLVDYDTLDKDADQASRTFFLNFYMICLKQNFQGKLKYGQHHYDFDEGVLSFISTKQLIGSIEAPEGDYSGYMLLVHPDFLRNYPLGKIIQNYGFFRYAVHEALHLSEKEENMLIHTMKNIEQEYLSAIDIYSQDVLIAHLELLLNYANRYYQRQFITRKNASNDLLTRFEELLTHYFESEELQERGLPSAQSLSEELHVSANYLSDMLRALTGQNTQQHIHSKLIENAKHLLVSTHLSVSEIAYQLGFEYPQSFSKLFRNKTKVSPMHYRNSFN